MDIQLVIFELSDEVYGVDVVQVRSIIPKPRLDYLGCKGGSNVSMVP
jgi:chemotaxis signal transduction protein